MSQYIIKFKKGADEAKVNELYEKIQGHGGEIKDKQHGSSLLPRATVTLPKSFAGDASALQKLQDDHSIIQYIEPDQEMKTQ